MADKSAIEWTDATWNPIAGCSIVSPGCTNCYAMKMAARLEAMGQPIYAGMTKKVNGKAVWTGKVEQSNWGQVIKPLSWKRPRMVFVNSMSDLFHEAVPDSLIDTVFAVMALCPQHTFQILTKRPQRMRDYAAKSITPTMIGECAREIRQGVPLRLAPWPLPNVWLGVSCERQQEADERIPLLLKTPAAVRFISAEPLLGPISLARIGSQDHWGSALEPKEIHGGTGQCVDMRSALDWVIIGGESGGDEARPFNVEWADSLVDQCREADVPCFVKQLGSFPLSDGYPLELHHRKGGDASEWPDRLRMREFPRAAAPGSPVVSVKDQEQNLSADI